MRPYHAVPPRSPIAGPPMTLVGFAVVAASLYFFGFGTGFIFRPQFADQLGLQWINPAGKTEVRCYYGAVSWALAGFLGYLLHQHQSVDALTGVLFLATAVFTMRVIGTTIDRAWREAYTKTAIPVEGLFVLVLAVDPRSPTGHGRSVAEHDPSGPGPGVVARPRIVVPGLRPPGGDHSGPLEQQPRRHRPRWTALAGVAHRFRRCTLASTPSPGSKRW